MKHLFGGAALVLCVWGIAQAAPPGTPAPHSLLFEDKSKEVQSGLPLAPVQE